MKWCPNKTNLCVAWIIEMMAKPVWRHFDVNHLTSRLQKGEGRVEGNLALEVVTDGKNDKTEKND